MPPSPTLARCLGLATVWALLAMNAAPAAAQPPQPGGNIEIPRVTRPPSLNDFLKGTPREAEAVVTGFAQRDPADGTPASQKTAAYLSYDATYLYVVFVCDDTEPDKVRARLTRREDIMGDEAVGVLLDTFHDRRRAYEFLANPLGVQLDGIATEGQNDDFSFDALWQSEGRVTPTGFVVWMAIPFKSLRFSGDAVQTWGIGLLRSIPRASELSFWPYVTKRISGFAQQLGTMTGLRAISPGRNVQFIPYGAFAGARFLEDIPAASGYRRKNDLRAGLDAKMVLRDAFTLDAAVNPDFSQIESDEPQVTVNQRFEVFFPEKRPFFIENAAFFQTPQTLLFSRRVADPQLGLRLTGKVGKWTVAGLAADDRAQGRRVAKDDPLFDTRAGIGVLRVQREFAKQSHVGAMVTSRDIGATSNRVASIDTRLRLGENWTGTAQAMASDTREAGGRRLSAPAYAASLLRQGRHLVFIGRYDDVAPDFQARLGFIRRVDLREVTQYTEYVFRPKKSRVLSFGPGGSASVLFNHAGQRQDRVFNPGFRMEFKGQTNVLITAHDILQRFRGRDFSTRSLQASFGTAWLKWLDLNGFVQAGTDVNFFPAAGLEPFEGNSRVAQMQATVRPTSQLRLDQTYIYSRLDVPPRPSADVRPGARIFANRLWRSRATYQFTRRLSLRAIVDYSAVLPDAGLISLQREKRLTADGLATYLINPWTAIYVGYTDGYANLAFDPTLPGTLRRTSAIDLSTGRQFFIKTSYLFRF